MAPRVEVTGLTELRRDLRKIKDVDLNDALKAANQELAAEIVSRALPNVPVGKTGRLKQSVRALGNLAGAVGKAGSKAVPYAAALHWGRKQGGVIEARPFLKDAADSLEPDIAARYLEKIDPVFDAVRARGI